MREPHTSEATKRSLGREIVSSNSIVVDLQRNEIVGGGAAHARVDSLCRIKEMIIENRQLALMIRVIGDHIASSAIIKFSIQ